MSKNILFKEELDYIIESFKNKKKYSEIGKNINRSTLFIKNEINKYIKDKHNDGHSIYKLSKEFNIPLDKIKDIIDNTKINDINYLEKNKAEQILELLKSKKKYNDIAKNLDTTKDTIVLYCKRKVNEEINKGQSKIGLAKLYNLTDSQVENLICIKKKNIAIKKTQVQELKDENAKLKKYIELLEKKLEN